MTQYGTHSSPFKLLIPPPLGLLSQTGFFPIFALGILGSLAFVLLLNNSGCRKAPSITPIILPQTNIAGLFHVVRILTFVAILAGAISLE